MQQLLTQQHPATLGPYKHETDCMFYMILTCNIQIEQLRTHLYCLLHSRWSESLEP